MAAGFWQNTTSWYSIFPQAGHPEIMRQIRSYVIRTGRLTPGQRRALEKYWPTFGLDPDASPLDAKHVFGNDNPLVVEVGFGMGDSLAEMAAADPGMNFVGIEVHRPGVGHLLRLAHERSLENLRIYCADVMEVFNRCIESASVDRIQIFFPDPWPKKRHHKRRLISREFGAQIEEKLKPGGIVHIATDWANYGAQISETLSGIRSLRAVSPPRRPRTKYESRGLGLGHEVIEIACRKRDA